MNYMNAVTMHPVQGPQDAETKRPYHHGDLKNALLKAARQILEEESPATLSLREVARRAGVSHAAPYRHFPSHEALLAELAIEGFKELKADLQTSADQAKTGEDRLAGLGTAYIRFVSQRTMMARLMFGPQLPNRRLFPALTEAADDIEKTIGEILQDPAFGLSVWAAIHGLAMLVLENVVDLGQRGPNIEGSPEQTVSLLRNLASISLK